MSKRIKALILTIIIAINTIILIPISNEIKVQAADTDATRFITYDEETENYVFESTDIKRTSTTFYRTLGFTISRCYPNEKTAFNESTPTEYVVINLSNLDQSGEPVEGVQKSEKMNADGTMTTTWLISKDYVYAKIDGYYPDWYEEITQNLDQNLYWLRFDAIMTIYQGENNPLGLMIDENCKGECYGNQVKTNMQLIPAFKSRLKQLGFNSNTINNCIDTHFNQFLPLNVPEPKEDEPLDAEKAPQSEFVETIGKEVPDYVTANYSGQYDLSKGIPSSEKLTNRVIADGWYGTADIGKRTVPKTWTIIGNISYKVRSGYSKSTKSWTYRTVVRSYSKNVTRTSSYYYVQEANFYDLTRLDVLNGAYPSGMISHVAANGKVIIDVTINGIDNPTEITSWVPDDDTHITWVQYSTNIGTVYKSSQSAAKEAFNNRAESQIPSAGYSTVYNDKIEINGKTYMNSDATSSPDVKKYQKVGAGDYAPETYTQIVQIPSDTPNGPYDTTLKAYYTRKTVNTNVLQAALVKSGDNAIQNGNDVEFTGGYTKLYKDNEPLYVHTPVISPVTIIDPDTGEKIGKEEQQTQLITENSYVDYQLKLDGTYTFDFSAAMHRAIQSYGWSYVISNDWTETDSQYDKYVSKKQVHFPFTVKIDGIYYEPVTDPNADGYWINLANLEKTEFYIPSWSTENCYGVSGHNETPILYRVISINGEDHLGDTQDTANTDITKYVATYRIPVQVSGLIYNFQIVGINDKDMYTGYETGWRNSWYAFCKNKEEKKSGTKNRLGGNYVRYTLDGTLTNNWSVKNTTPLCNGTSWEYENMGAIWKGTRFAFSVKTIANLWDEDIDKMMITPSFKYFDVNGNSEAIDVYYSMGKNLFVKMGSEEDTALKQKVSFKGNGGEFDGSYYDEDFTYTVDKHNEITGDNLTERGLRNREVESYCLSSIELNSKLRLLTGNLEQCAENIDKEKLNSNFKTLAQLQSVASPSQIEPSDYEKDIFRMSMQTWYGEYYIPSNLYICPAGTDVEVYGKENGLTGEEDFWKKDGYVVLNFNIKTINNNEDHLQYYGGTNDQWTKESNGRTTVPVGDKDFDTEKPIPIKPGDVAIIEIEHSLKDKYSFGVFEIN